MIEVRNVSKIFKLSRKQRKEMGGNFQGNSLSAVDDITFTCTPGRIFGLIGPNGAGKTTTLRMIATMLTPTKGEIIVGNYNTRKDPRKIRQQLGFLSGNTGLYDRLTAEEMVKYYADLYGMDARAYRKRRDELFDTLGMEEFASRRIAKLSTGMKQKVSIARTIVHDPEIVIFDEPTSGLDVMTSKSIIQLIRSCRERGNTVIFSTHRMGELRLLCDDLAIIHKGKLYFNGTYQQFEDQQQAATLEDEFIRLTEEAV
ncbi:MAG: ATP-binding cassette domain-containing protein [FCB group bacterium]|nr:ATP-binding cassette domain-containing protein [FCB group bacterium]